MTEYFLGFIMLQFALVLSLVGMNIKVNRALPFSTILVGNNTQGHPLVTSLNVSKFTSGNACQWLPYLHCKGWPFCLFTLSEVACLQFFTNYTFALGVLSTCRFCDVLSQTLPPSFMKDWLVMVCKYSTQQFGETKPGRRHLQAGLGYLLHHARDCLASLFMQFVCTQAKEKSSTSKKTVLPS